MENAIIKGYHAHVYFASDTVEQARVLRGQIDQEFDYMVGRFHEKNVGPHPRWSFQIAFKPDEFGIIVPWLTLNRKGLTVFVHAVTGDDLYDHTELVMWLGESAKINLGIFSRRLSENRVRPVCCSCKTGTSAIHGGRSEGKQI